MLQKVLGATDFSACEPEKKSREVLCVSLLTLVTAFPVLENSLWLLALDPLSKVVHTAVLVAG